MLSESKFTTSPPHPHPAPNHDQSSMGLHKQASEGGEPDHIKEMTFHIAGHQRSFLEQIAEDRAHKTLLSNGKEKTLERFSLHPYTPNLSCSYLR